LGVQKHMDYLDNNRKKTIEGAPFDYSLTQQGSGRIYILSYKDYS